MLTYFTLSEFLIQLNFRVGDYRKTINCTNFDNRVHAFFNLAFPELFDVIFYNEFFGILAISVSILCEFSRAYVDIVLICIFLALREQFWMLNKSVLRTPINVSLPDIFYMHLTFYFILFSRNR